MGETPKLKRISFGSTPIHKLLHLLLIKCNHMLPLKFRTIPAIPSVVPFPSSPHLSWLPVAKAPSIAMALFASSNKASNAALSPSTCQDGTSMVSCGFKSGELNFLPEDEDSWLGFINTSNLDHLNSNWLRIAPHQKWHRGSLISVFYDIFYTISQCLIPQKLGPRCFRIKSGKARLWALYCWQHTGSSILNLQTTWLPKTEQCPCFNLWFSPLNRRVFVRENPTALVVYPLFALIPRMHNVAHWS